MNARDISVVKRNLFIADDFETIKIRSLTEQCDLML